MAKKKAGKKIPSEPVTQPEVDVIRISAKDDKKTSQKAAAPVEKQAATTDKAIGKKSFLKSFTGYFKGAWQELKQTRWPNRQTTWKLTAAVIIFTAIFVTIIILLDIGLETLFDKIN